MPPALPSFPKDPEILSYFDRVIARDGTDDALFDLALADPWRRAFAQASADPRTFIATCYRGRQGDISPIHRSLYEIAEAVIEPVARRLAGEQILRIDTLTPTPRRVQAISDQFARAKLVFTTRLHGSLLSLDHGTPFVAVDQIQHGQKVTHVLRKLRWPYCFVANEIGQRELEAAARDALHEGFRPTLERMRKSAIQMANDTLATVCDTVVDAAFKA